MRDGDRDAAQAYIAQALARLNGQLSLAPPCPAKPSVTKLRRGQLAPWQARRIVSYIDDHLAERVRIDELASLVELSKFHFCRVFKLTFGVSTQAWVLQRRIEVAQGLMLTTGDNLTEIALRCGMCDQSHFTRAFRRLVGETPYRWRRMRRGAMLEHSPSDPADPCSNA